MPATEILRTYKRIGRAVTYLRLRALHSFLKPVAKLLYGKQHIWIIAERGTDARDNGFHLYRFIRDRHPETKVFYIIEKSSADSSRVAALGNMVERGSLKHWLLYLGAEIRISTHINGFIPKDNWHYQQFVSKRRSGEKVVFLRHGVGKDNVRSHYKENTNVSLFLCGAKPEYEYVLSHYGYSAEEVKYTGLARFDGLHGGRAKRQVLIMPTWRSWLSSKWEKVTLQDVQNSTYLKKWLSFLNSERLQAMAREYDVSFLFYPHYEIQPYLPLFKAVDGCVTVADFAHFDVQQLLKESMLLITDFSSVFFDFAYLQKPVLYYQFDEAEYRAQHYEQGYFEYRWDGFGEVVTEEEELLTLLEQYLGAGCRLKAEYLQRIRRFFPLHDAENCERIYQEILKLQRDR